MLNLFADQSFNLPEDDIVVILLELAELEVTVPALMETGAGVVVRRLEKKSQGMVSKLAREVVIKWKGIALKYGPKPPVNDVKEAVNNNPDSPFDDIEMKEEIDDYDDLEEIEDEVSCLEEVDSDKSDLIEEEGGMDLTKDKSKEPDFPEEDNNTKKFPKNIIHWNPHSQNQNFENGKILPPVATTAPVQFSSHLPSHPIPTQHLQLPPTLPEPEAESSTVCLNQRKLALFLNLHIMKTILIVRRYLVLYT